MIPVRHTADRAGDASYAAALLAALVASAFGICAEALCDSGRGTAEVVFARQVAMYLSYTRLGLTLALAGAAFGRDRTTAAHACRAVEERREDPTVDAMIDWLGRAIEAARDVRA